MTHIKNFVLIISNLALSHWAAALNFRYYQQSPLQTPSVDFKIDFETVMLNASTIAEKRQAVKNAFVHAWEGYKMYTWGHDEVRPVSGLHRDPRNGWGATIIDSLDVLYMMNLTTDFHLARNYVASLDWWNTSNPTVGVFETVIRYIGGLISAYELSQDSIFLEKATELADMLMPSFLSLTGLPYQSVDIRTGKPVKSGYPFGASILAEVGTIQLEFTRLSELTHNWTYHHKAQRVIDFFDTVEVDRPGLFPVLIDVDTGKFVSDKVTWGGLGDSFWEYLIKAYHLGGHRQEQLRRMFVAAVESLDKYMTSRVREWPDLLFITELEGEKQVFHMDELACFLPGTLLLADHILSFPKARRLAHSLMHSCYHVWETTPTGIAPENWYWVDDSTGKSNGPETRKNKKRAKEWGFWPAWPGYILRPETIESLFYFYRITGDRIYQDMGWSIFQSLIRNCRTPIAFSGLRDVTAVEPEWDDVQESFFYAETLKYLYLLFGEDKDEFGLDEWVFNTEAHPFRVRASKKKTHKYNLGNLE